VEFGSMQQVNAATQFKRKVRRQEAGQTGGAPAPALAAAALAAAAPAPQFGATLPGPHHLGQPPNATSPFPTGGTMAAAAKTVSWSGLSTPASSAAKATAPSAAAGAAGRQCRVCALGSWSQQGGCTTPGCPLSPSQTARLASSRWEWWGRERAVSIVCTPRFDWYFPMSRPFCSEILRTETARQAIAGRSTERVTLPSSRRRT
jgi:hypothetical protein